MNWRTVRWNMAVVLTFPLICTTMMSLSPAERRAIKNDDVEAISLIVALHPGFWPTLWLGGEGWFPVREAEVKHD